MQVDFIQVVKSLAAAYNLQLTRVAYPFTEMRGFDFGLRQSLDPQLEWDVIGRQILEEMTPNILIIGEDVFEMQFAIFMLPDEKEAAYILGPWVSKERTQNGIDWCLRYLGEESNQAIDQFYNGVCHMKGEAFCSVLRSILVSVCGPDLEMVQSKAFRPLIFEPDLRCFEEPLFEKDLPAAMLERRYATETAVMTAVEKGDVSSAIATFEQLARYRIGKRFGTPLRDAKTTLVVINVLLRKAIQKGGVHPYYIDKISGRYAVRIENLTEESQAKDLSLEMVREYCMYVQKYSLKKYSPLVQKVLNYINLNLSSALSLKNLANMCFISPSYLSYLFKQETGSTLTDYINTQRVERAARRLRTTEDTVAEIAENVGILDVNYFTKIFKKRMGVTPTAYRKKSNQ